MSPWLSCWSRPGRISVAAAVAVCRFVRRPLPGPSERPPISVLKPLHPSEPGLHENLRSFAEQDYPSIQLVLGASEIRWTSACRRPAR